MRTGRYFPKTAFFLFLGGYIALALAYDYPKTMFALPQSVHQWRQADCLSITSNYYYHSNPFLEPAIHYLGSDETGKTMSEFPIVYYGIAQIWKITGHRIWIYRACIAFLFFLGLLAVFKLAELVLKDSWFALFSSLLLFTSPVLVYYSNSFLMNIPALSFALIGFYCFFLYWNRKRTYLMVIGFSCYILASLLKVSSLLSLIAILILFISEHLNFLPVKSRLFRKTWHEYIGFCLCLLIPFLWYQFAISYNNQHTGQIFLTGILPVWEMTMPKIKETLLHIGRHLRWDYFRPAIEILLLFLLISTIPLRKNIDGNLLKLMALLCIGAIGFGLLFFGALQWHDYYIIDLYIMVPVLLLAFFQGIKVRFPRLASSPLLLLVLLIVLIHSADFARRRIDERYDINNYRNLHHRDIFQAFSEIGPLLEEWGIGPDEKVLSLSDYSINISLYLMNRWGWTDYGLHLDPKKIEEKIDLGVRYLFIADDKTLQNPVLAPFLEKKIGSYRNISVFELTPGK